MLQVRRATIHRLRVWTVVDLKTFRQIEASFELSSNLQHRLLVLVVRRPQTDSISLWTNVDCCTAHIAVVVKSFADQAQDLKHIKANMKSTAQNVSTQSLLTHRINPVSVEVLFLSRLKCEPPYATVLVRLVFPHRTDVVLEQRIITADPHLARLLDVREQAPEVFDCGEL